MTDGVVYDPHTIVIEAIRDAVYQSSHAVDYPVRWLPEGPWQYE